MSEMPPPPNEPGSAGSTPPPTPPESLSPPPSPDMGDPIDVEKNKVYALLSYIYILWLVPLLAAKDSPFAKYHANQGLVLFLAFTLIYIVLGCAGFAVSMIHALGIIATCFSCIIWPLVALGHIAAMIMGILNALNGRMRPPIPGMPTIALIK